MTQTSSFGEVGVLSYSVWRRVGVNDVSNEAYWTTALATANVYGGLCCLP